MLDRSGYILTLIFDLMSYYYDLTLLLCEKQIGSPRSKHCEVSPYLSDMGCWVAMVACRFVLSYDTVLFSTCIAL